MLRDDAPTAFHGVTRRARRLRREMTLPEVMLWQVLRGRPSGLKFRRQHPSGDYVLDYFCSDARLAIEVDGEGHGRGRQPVVDARRDSWFEARGIVTLRVSARDVLGDLDAVVTGVVQACVARLPLHHPATRGGPPPRAKLGEE
ncbi:Very-short-patch-repair endonuclease [Sphingomonas sp. OV641]|uniref:endonuclease domain-containing protein n=1 Tax=Sphingomonas sp. OV641 TaxID=1881068 RepID=UPI0008B45F6C|nr:endonuclease domain-containing protein [Sphingomonas sp. OV641]SEJ32744.1 Very-short-patch-repair endonuclease [Sphingomonas sp. OV641]